MKRLFSLSLITYVACSLAGLNACKEEKEEPLLFETTAPTSYTFPETATSATFTVSGNTAWTVEVTKGRDRCNVTPASGKGSATVTVHITANPSYVQSDMTLSLVAGKYIKQIAVTQAAPPCPGFNPGAIATAGQTVTIGGAPATINSTQAATGGDGQITYQWYKNGNPIDGATAASYTPPKSAATAAGAMTYTRRANDNTCNTTFTPSTGSWVLTVVCPAFSPGAIATTGQTVLVGGTPVTINSTQNATSENGAISYRWYKNGNAISGATAAGYTPPKSDANAAGVHTYTRRAGDNVCNTTFTPSAGSWVLTVMCPSFNPGAIATDGQNTFVGGTPVTINSVQNATGEGNISYQWYKNGNAIDGATAATYTPPIADAAVAGVYTYTRHANDNLCNTTLTPSTGSWVLTVCAFNAGAIATIGQNVCIGNAVNTIISNTDASGGDGNITYEWRRNGAAISGANAADYTPVNYNTTIGAHTFTRWAHDGSCKTAWTQSAGSWVLTVKDVPTLTLTSGNANPVMVVGYTTLAIKYTTANASGASASNLPAGIFGEWSNNAFTISGTPVAIGAHTYTVTTANTNGCANASRSGTITVSNSMITIGGIAVQLTDVSGTEQWYSADRLCEQSTVGGQRGWRLPSESESTTLYVLKTSIGGFHSGSYWVFASCNGVHMYRNFSTGMTGCSGLTASVRCVKTW